MIQSRIQIGDSDVVSVYDGHKLIHMESDTRFEAPIKKRDTTSYAEDAGEHVDPRTVQDAFDYKVTFIVEAPNKDLTNANAIIAEFNKKLYTQDADSAIRTYKEVTFYNDFKRIKIVGLPEPIQEAKELYRRQDGSVMDCAQVEWTIRVSDPSKCEFDIPEFVFNLKEISYSITAGTFSKETSGKWNFRYGFIISNDDGEGFNYTANDIKFSRNVLFKIIFPKGYNIRKGDIYARMASGNGSLSVWNDSESISDDFMNLSTTESKCSFSTAFTENYPISGERALYFRFSGDGQGLARFSLILYRYDKKQYV